MTDPAPTREPTRGGSRLRVWPWGLLAMLALLAIGLVAAWRWLGSEAALQYALAELATRSGGRVSVQDARGSLLSTVHARELRYDDADRHVRAQDVELEWSVGALLDRTLHVERLRARELTVALGPPTDEPLELPESIALPLRVRVDRAEADRIEIERGTAHWTITGLRFAYEGGPDGHRVRDLALAADPGTLAGHVELGAKRPFPIAGELVLTGSEALHNPVLRIALGGSVETLDLEADGSIAAATLRGSARFAPLAKVTLPRFEIAVNGLDPHAIEASLPSATLDAVITGTGSEGARFEGTFVAANAIPGPIDAQRIPLRRIESRYVLTTAEHCRVGSRGDARQRRHDHGFGASSRSRPACRVRPAARGISRCARWT